MAGFGNAVGPGGGVGTGITTANPSRYVDITDVLYEIVPLKKPLFHLSGDGPRPKDRFHQWMRRTYTTRARNADAVGAVFNFVDANKLPTLDQFNYVQIFTKYIRVSDMEQATQHYAIPDLLDDQVKTELGILGTEIEAAIWRESLDSISLGNMTVPRMQGVMMGIFCGGTTFTNMLGVVFTETILNNELARLFDIGAEPQDAWLGARLQNVVSGFTGGTNQTRFIEADRTTAIFSILEYQSALQQVHFHISRDVYSGTSSTSATLDNVASQSGNSLVLLDMSMIRKCWLEPVLVERAPRTALSMDVVAHCMLTMEWGHPHAHAWLANFSA